MDPEIVAEKRTLFPPFSILRGMKEVRKKLQRQTSLKKTNPPFLAINEKYLAFFPNNIHFPIKVTPTTIHFEEQQLSGVAIQFWQENDPKSASGIMHENQIFFIRQGNSIYPFFRLHHDPFSGDIKERFAKISERSFLKEAHKLHRQITQAMHMSIDRMPNIYQDQHYSIEQLAVSRQLLHTLTELLDIPGPTQRLRRSLVDISSKVGQTIPFPAKTRAA